MSGIVVGVDGSEHSLDALRWAASEAKLRGATLRVVASFSTPLMSTGYEVAVPDSSDLAAASTTMLKAALDSVRSSGVLEGVDVITEVLEGHAGEQLIRLSENADLLVVGARGHGGFLGLLMGSVTTYAVNHALCPVVVVRTPTTD
jgi:nucleotide-binding universal stress UspA family protein